MGVTSLLRLLPASTMSRRKVNANPTDDSSPQNSIKASPNAVQEVERLKLLLEAEKEKGVFVMKPSPSSKMTKPTCKDNLGKKDELIHQLLSKKDDDNSRVMSGKSSVKRKHGDDRKAPLKKAKQLKSNVIDDEEEEFSSVLSDSSEVCLCCWAWTLGSLLLPAHLISCSCWFSSPAPNLQSSPAVYITLVQTSRLRQIVQSLLRSSLPAPPLYKTRPASILSSAANLVSPPSTPPPALLRRTQPVHSSQAFNQLSFFPKKIHPWIVTE
ncbi:uncharacterized protein LOC125900983 [Epinephelus fuscoguttatus]|uniref:uncharacterized protein LOC125900983 n=1 Tax=Epinephelus fuscoguttatus TaxID=293821 RepID=UPI0020D0D1A0|nr:uncharacterized protein LOC125900983 [Epinephelus fuscoguttatus]